MSVYLIQRSKTRRQNAKNRRIEKFHQRQLRLHNNYNREFSLDNERLKSEKANYAQHTQLFIQDTLRLMMQICNLSGLIRMSCNNQLAIWAKQNNIPRQEINENGEMKDVTNA